MGKAKKQVKSYSLDARVSQVRDAWRARFQRSVPAEGAEVAESWPHEVFDDRLIVHTPEGFYAYPYELEDGAPVFGEPEKVEVDYVPVKGMAIKMLQEDGAGAIVGGYLVQWGDPERRDIHGEYFTKSTELWFDRYPKAPALFHHGFDKNVGLSVIGHRIKAVPDDVGAWVQHWLDKSSEYWEMVEPLLKAEALYYSPGSAPHLVRVSKSGELLAFPSVEDTLTVIPAQFRQRPVAQIKAAYRAAGLELPDELEAESGEDAGASCSEQGLEALTLVQTQAKALAVRARMNQSNQEQTS